MLRVNCLSQKNIERKPAYLDNEIILVFCFTSYNGAIHSNVTAYTYYTKYKMFYVRNDLKLHCFIYKYYSFECKFQNEINKKPNDPKY